LRRQDHHNYARPVLAQRPSTQWDFEKKTKSEYILYSRQLFRLLLNRPWATTDQITKQQQDHETVAVAFFLSESTWKLGAILKQRNWRKTYTKERQLASYGQGCHAVARHGERWQIESALFLILKSLTKGQCGSKLQFESINKYTLYGLIAEMYGKVRK
jgi:hypothetical protein